MMPAAETRSLIERLPPVRGRLTADAPLTRYTWFRTGGPAEVLFEPADEADLTAMLRGLPEGVPLTVIGIGSNLLVRDGGVEGLVVRLGKPFAWISITENRIEAGAGAGDIAVANAAREAGLTGLEFLRGIPGTLGGGVRMNAGAYGREIADILCSARVIDRPGAVHELSRDELGFGYRHSALPHGWIVTAATLEGRPDAPEAIAARMAAITAERESTQPVRTRTGGSTFRNPGRGPKAWELIDAAGCRGLRIGGAQISEKHANFLINTGDATAADLERLGEEVRRRVYAHSGIRLAWEIERIGRATSGGGRS